MKRQSSNRVKILKIEARATKAKTKLTTRVRKSVASSKLGKPQVPIPNLRRKFDLVTAIGPLSDFFRLMIEATESHGTRPTSRNIKLKVNIRSVASQAPTNGGTVPTLASDSPNSEPR